MKKILALSLLLFASAAFAQNYPAKPVRWVVPFPPGGGTDLISRVIAAELSKLWNVQVVADNRPGGGGTIGAELDAKAVALGLYGKLPYDPIKDLQPVTQVIATPIVIVSHPSFPAKNAKELITYAKAHPDAVTFGSPGNGTIGHLSVEMLKSMAGIKMLHIPYKGASLAITELIGGQITIYGSSMPPALPLIQGGKLRALGVTSAKRLAPLPGVPTIAESGVKDYEAVNWYGVLTPAGVPKEIVAKLHTDIVRILKQADVQERFKGEGGDVVGNMPEEFAAFIQKEVPKWSKVVKDANVKVD